MPTTARSHSARARFRRSRSLGAALGVIAGLSLLLGVVELALLPLGGVGGPLLAMLPVIFWIYIGAGLLAWARRPSNGMGLLIVATGIALFLGSAGNTGVPVLEAISAITATLVLATMVHLVLAFPSGRVADRASRAVVVSGYVVALILGAPSYLLDPDGSYPPFAIADVPDFADAGYAIQSICGGVVLLAAAGILIRRVRQVAPRQRRVLAPLFSYAIVALLLIPLLADLAYGVLGWDWPIVGGLQFVVVAGVPIVFALATVRGGFARTRDLEELGAGLGDRERSGESLEHLLGRVLGDRTLRLAFRAGQNDGFVDAEGAVVTPPTERNRGWQEITLDGRVIGAVDYDAQLLAEPELVRTAGRIVAIAVERERLNAELVASRRAVLKSRERLVGAADRERRRIARDLHDGIQVHLVLLALEAQQIATAPPEAVAERATRLRRDIDAAAAELRTLVYDLVPAALIERGLAAAAEDLVDRMPIPTRLEIDLPARLDDATENTAYFVLTEALTNVVKHSGAAHAAVTLTLITGSSLRLEVKDDGDGGADIDAGAGMRGLVDRVEAVGGTIQVRSEKQKGTTVWMDLPRVSS